MFRKEVKNIGELILKNLRAQGLETPLQQKRLIAAWPEVMGELIAGYTQDLYIKNQTLNVRLSNPALRADLSMMRPEIVKKLNEAVGSQVIAEIRFCGDCRDPFLLNHPIYRHIMGIDRHFGYFLEVEADANGLPPEGRQETIVIPLPPA